jgi:hypothetical protein
VIVVGIQGVALTEADVRLRRRRVDVPQAGLATEGSALDLVRWVLSKDCPAVAVEVLDGQTLIRHLPLAQTREKNAKQLSGWFDGWRSSRSYLGHRPGNCVSK